jgi:hypothetical protein
MDHPCGAVTATKRARFPKPRYLLRRNKYSGQFHKKFNGLRENVREDHLAHGSIGRFDDRLRDPIEDLHLSFNTLDVSQNFAGQVLMR